MKAFKTALTVLLFMTTAVWRCSTNLAGGGSESGNPVIVGTIVDKNGTPVSNTQVMAIRPDYNPVTDGPLPDSLIDTTDAWGKYRFSVSDSAAYNIQAIHLSVKTGLFIRSIFVTQDTTILKPDTLMEPGFVNVLLPDTLDTNNSFIFVKGTTLYSGLSGVVKVGLNAYSILFDSVIADSLPPLYYDKTDDSRDPVELVDFLVIRSNDTTDIALTVVTSRRVLGKVVSSNGLPVSGVRITLIPMDHNPVIDGPLPDSLRDTTDASGVYMIDNPGYSSYNIEANHLSTRKKFFHPKIAVSKDTIISAGTDTLKEVGLVKVIMPDTVTIDDAYLFIQGTSRYTILSNAQHINNSYVALVDSVAPGKAPSLYYDILNNPQYPVLVSDSVKISPNDTTVIYAFGVLEVSPSIFFVIDNSGSMMMETGTDRWCQRFTVAMWFIDSIKTIYPDAEVGLSIFQSELYLDPNDDTRFVVCPGYTVGSYLPLLKLNQVYNGETGYQILRKYLVTDTLNLTEPYAYLVYTPSTIDPEGATNINVGLTSAKNAFTNTDNKKPERHFVVLLSDGEANVASGPETDPRAYVTKVEGLPTTFTVFFTDSSVAPQEMIDFTNNVQKNGYSSINDKSNLWSIHVNNLKLLLINNVIKTITANK